MKICYFGTFESNYDRNRILLQGLRELGHEVDICHAPFWEDTRHKTGAVTDPRALLSMGKRLTLAYSSLAWRYLRAKNHDAVIVGYMGHLDVFPARLLSWLRKKPLVFDAFISLYDTLVGDREVIEADSIQANLLRVLDAASCLSADRVLLDTNSHIDYFVEEFGVDRSKFQRVLVGADPSYFYRPKELSGSSSGKFTVLHYSKFAPLHGLPSILEAAKLLENDEEIEFLLVGGGQIKEEVNRTCKQLNLTNVRRIDWMTPDELRVAIASSGACLGVFGDTAKAARVIPNKVYQCMAVGAPIVTRDSEAIRELLEHERSALLCPPANAEAIAAALARLYAEPELRVAIAERSHEIFLQNCGPAELCRPLERTLRELSRRS